MERAALLSHDFIACAKKSSLEEIIATASENNMRLRKKLDLIKYEREKVRVILNIVEYRAKIIMLNVSTSALY